MYLQLVISTPVMIRDELLPYNIVGVIVEILGFKPVSINKLAKVRI